MFTSVVNNVNAFSKQYTKYALCAKFIELELFIQQSAIRIFNEYRCYRAVQCEFQSHNIPHRMK